MIEDTDELFVIDKSGGANSKSSKIIYDSTEKEDLGLGTVLSTEPSTAPARPRRPITGKRYHEAEDFSKFRPGSISEELRDALNLAPHELPIHIYRMRTLGYPPGWLRKARVGGELKMFDSVAALAEDTEVTYNRDLLIGFMGFNTRIEYPFIDECDVLNCPRMQSHHRLDNFYAALSRSSQLHSAQNNGGRSFAELEKLRAERERIIAEIRKLDTHLVTSGNVSESGDNPKPLANSDRTAKENPVGNGVIKNEREASLNPSTSQVFLISASEDGTPTPSRLTELSDASKTDGTPSFPSAKRPNIDAFSVGVQPFRPFENLPGTEGGYKRVLETLRNSRNESSTDSLPGLRGSNQSASELTSSFDTSTPYRRSKDRHSPYDRPYSADHRKNRRRY